MKLLNLDLKKGLTKIFIEDLDDIWHLYNVIEKNDLLYAKTTREIKASSEGARPSSGRRVSLTLGIKVTDFFFDKNTNRLRVRGIIIDAPTKYEGLLSAYHTISLAVDGLLTLIKEKLADYHVRRIKDACEVKIPKVIIIAIDDEEVCIATLEHFGFKIKFEKLVKLPGKREADKRQGEVQKYFTEVSQALAQTYADIKGKIVIVGPGFIRREFANFLRDRSPRIATSLVYVGSGSFGGSAGVSEALRSGALTTVLKKSRVVEEMNLVENFFKSLSVNVGSVAYGLLEVQRAASYGAVDTLMVVDKLLRESQGDDRAGLEGVMRTVEKNGGKIVILSGEHEGG
ncbi:MAG: mRNA surveillance protein pelota, partial [Candidatus Bathyarchaeota archaeon]